MVLGVAALNGVDGSGNLVGTVGPHPVGVPQAHGHVPGLGSGETDLVVGGGVPDLSTPAPYQLAAVERLVFETDSGVQRNTEQSNR